MPRQITTTVYTYKELPTKKAKRAARNWWLEVFTSDTYDMNCNMIKEDARNIGLKIEQLGPLSVDNEGEFIGSAFDTMNKIREDHGEECETFKAAKKYEDAIDALPDQVTNLEEESRNHEALDTLETEFLADLLEAYRQMREKEDEYQLSDEAIAESMEANEYTFTDEGKRFG